MCRHVLSFYRNVIKGELVTNFSHQLSHEIFLCHLKTARFFYAPVMMTPRIGNGNSSLCLGHQILLSFYIPFLHPFLQFIVIIDFVTRKQEKKGGRAKYSAFKHVVCPDWAGEKGFLYLLDYFLFLLSLLLLSCHPAI